MELLNFTDKVCTKCGTSFQTVNEKAELCLECLFPKEEATKINPYEIIIKRADLDKSKLKSVSHNQIYRPKDFDTYIGQEALKNILKGHIKGCKEQGKPFPHTLIDGKAGTGKTAIAYILAQQLGLNFVECVGNSIKDEQQLVDKLVETNGGILFIDEIHMINARVANFLLPIMEDFQIEGQEIPKFTLITATTEKGILIRKFKPLIDRFKIQKRLDSYNEQNIATIVSIYRDKVFPNAKVSEAVIKEISSNSRLTPRIAIRLLESFIFMGKTIGEIFKDYNIVKQGVTEDDIRLLSLLDKNEKGLGLTTICAYLQTSKENYLYSVESYLIEQGFLGITNKRFITSLGKEFLKGI